MRSIYRLTPGIRYASASQLLRFCLVGVVNTGIDVSLFTALRLAHVPLVPANICSTSTALLCSLVLNYRFTFKNRSLTRLRVAGYITVTLFGLWALQPICIKLVMAGLAQVSDSQFIRGAVTRTALPKVLAVVVTMAWNYAWYSRVIFVQPARNGTTAAASPSPDE